MLTPVQIRMAICALQIPLRELSEATGITAGTLSKIQRGGEARTSNLQKIRGALEARGIRFEERDGLLWVGMRPESNE